MIITLARGTEKERKREGELWCTEKIFQYFEIAIVQLNFKTY